MSICNGIILKKNIYNGQKVKKWDNNGVRVFTAGSTVTYYVDSGVSYTEEVDSEASCLYPTTFTPTKSGWTFVGWREDNTASSSVLNSKVMGDSPITLYAVFRAAVTVTYYNNSTSASSTTGYRYYNNGNVINPSFTLTQAASSGWTARGWSTSNSGNAGITYSNGATFTRDSNITLYGLYQQTITLSYNGNGATGGSTASQTGIRYWAPAGYINPTFTLATNGFTLSNCTWQAWAIGSASGTQYAKGASVTLSSSTVFYAKWTGTVTQSIAAFSTTDRYSDDTYLRSDESKKIDIPSSVPLNTSVTISFTANITGGHATQFTLYRAYLTSDGWWGNDAVYVSYSGTIYAGTSKTVTGTVTLPHRNAQIYLLCADYGSGSASFTIKYTWSL